MALNNAQKLLAGTLSLVLVIGMTSPAFAIPFDGIEFPDGVSSFADGVLTYDNLFDGGPHPLIPILLIPLNL